MVSTAMPSFLPVNNSLSMPLADQQKKERSPATPTPSSAPGIKRQSNGQALASQTHSPTVTSNGISKTDLSSNRGTNNVTVTEQHQQPPHSHTAYTQSHTMSGSSSTPNRGAAVSREGSSTHSSAFDELQHPDSDGEHYPSDNEVEMGGTGNAGPSGTGPAGTSGAGGAATTTSTAPAGPPSKKKKGQRFYCTDFPPCNLNFTRKNTPGNARFSVIVHAGSPVSTIYASMLRLYMLMKTYPVIPSRPPEPASSARYGPIGFPPTHQELRRRPPPLMMAGSGPDPARGRLSLSLETMGEPPKTPPNQSVSGPIFTPSSATYDQSSPYYASPSSAYGSSYWPDRTFGRRLSVPTGTRPFDSHSNYPSQSPFIRMTHPPHPGPSIAPAPAPVLAPAPTEGPPYASVTPTSSIDSGFEADPRRRTWHPSSYTGFARPAPATSSLWFQQSADPPSVTAGVNVPPISSPSQQTTTRLPGIESFDQVPPRRDLDRDRDTSPMTLDRRHYQPQPYSQPPPPPSHIISSSSFAPTFNATPRPAPPFSGAEHRRGQLSLDTTLQRTLTRLDLHGNGSSSGSAKDAASWSQATLGELQSIGSRPSTGAGTGPLREEAEHEEDMAGDDGPGPDVPTEMPTTQSQPAQYETSATEQQRMAGGSGGSSSDGLGRLEALVAVATSENKKTNL
ncbi:zinc finger protein [Microsporum canis CBS 113480]|uniref:Zinc finger protein n=1 Tax=Arthroderma otae (strain ATCC MYA-4605 / CBS 113480) TaxID=554155 RepID=C5FLP6_ARTOC|nr:zinc finger protein [Microsporum canis CBS 113480]EEQ30618.1 zinc finger protein [Microsporum canis CBS 113480]